MKTLITISNGEKKEYFFTNNHCQDHNLGDDWVPCTFYLPMKVVERESCPDGIVNDINTLRSVFYYDYKEISNPNGYIDEDTLK